ncbi:MAG TPA: response regulator transcription factor [Baekduia sp.]|nr:response regulator transcription factor [Baekduia sp.]
MIRVAVAEDNLLVREGIVHLLVATPDVEVVAACEDSDGLLDALAQRDIDVVLTDIRMPPSGTDEGIRLAVALRDTHPDVGVIVVSQHDDPAYALALFHHGSDRRGYLLKHRLHDRAQLATAVRSVAEGGSVVDPKVVDALVAAKTRGKASALTELTPREREVLAEIAQGKSNAAIAGSLFLTKRAVEKHINAIFLKLDLAFADDVSKRVKATLLFLAEPEQALFSE